jgi:hypothetical protein
MIKCTVCGGDSTILLTQEEKWRLEFSPGAMIQDLFPDWTVDKREQWISGTHGKCFDDLFKEEEDE